MLVRIIGTKIASFFIIAKKSNEKMYLDDEECQKWME